MDVHAIRIGILIAAVISSTPTAANAVDIDVAVDASTLHHKVLCGYQGWFRCPNDPAGQGWRHWSRDGRKLTEQSLTFEMWPDMSEADADEKYPAPSFRYANGDVASLFSSANRKTVERHFRWMQQYEIDGVFLQRFLVEADASATDLVMSHVRESCKTTGRVMGLCYDLSGADSRTLFDKLVNDWKRLVDEQHVTRDNRYLHHDGKPVLFIWGFYSDRFGPELAHKIIDFFKNDPKYGVTLVGGCEWYWRTVKNAAWGEVFRRFDVISPWNVGNYTTVEGRRFAATESWKGDLEECRRNGMQFLPVIYPGFGWRNLKGEGAAKNDLPRLGGEFFKRQFATAADLGVEMAYVAMFDEVDEGTAIFKVTNSPPKPGSFATYEGLPSDTYLRLTGEGAKQIRGERATTQIESK